MARKQDAEAPRLKDLQRWMLWAITERGEEPTPSCRALVVDAGAASSAERLDVYARSWFTRLLESLEEDFEAVRAAVGEEIFDELVADYLDEHPSRVHTLALVGEKFAEFLDWREISSELPYLSDLARLEWAVIRARRAAAAGGLRAGELALVAADEWPRVRLRLAPSVALLRSDWDVDAMRKQPGSVAELRASWLVVHRRGLRVEVSALSDLEFRVLELLFGGVTLESLCERVELMLPEDAELPPLMAWFKSWLEAGIIELERP